MEPISILLNQEFNLLNTIANVGMTWWVSSIVFCGSALGGIWVKRPEVIKMSHFGLLGFFLGVFFGSIVLFGVLMIYATVKLQTEIELLQSELNIMGHIDHVGFIAIKYGYALGTTSFILVLLIWILMWRDLYKEHKLYLSNSFNKSFKPMPKNGAI